MKAEITAVIEGQLAAFRKGDYPQAYTFAAAEIRGLFPLQEFERMVKSAYPAIAGSQKAEFGLAFDTETEAVVNVIVSGANRRVTYQYHLKKESGGWKIGGVEELQEDTTFTV